MQFRKQKEGEPIKEGNKWKSQATLFWSAAIQELVDSE